MKVVKYVGKKQGGMPVTFPVGVKSRSAITHHKVANPYLELTDDEAATLLAGDAERVAKSGHHVKEIIDRKSGNVVRTDKVEGPPSAEPNFVEADADEYEAWKSSAGEKVAKKAAKAAEPEADPKPKKPSRAKKPKAE